MSTTPRTIRFGWEDFPAGSVREFGAKPVCSGDTPSGVAS